MKFVVIYFVISFFLSALIYAKTEDGLFASAYFVVWPIAIIVHLFHKVWWTLVNKISSNFDKNGATK